MIDYEDVKAVFAAKLDDDLTGKGRVESAAYHTARHIYLKGVEDGIEAARLKLEAQGLKGAALIEHIDALRELVSFR